MRARLDGPVGAALAESFTERSGLRESMRTFLAAVAVLGCLWATSGCERQVCLVRTPPSPYFGPRLVGPAQVPSPLPSTMARVTPPRQEAPPAASVRPSVAVAAWDPGGEQRPWRFIVVHHSATAKGSAIEFDRMHKAKGWDELGYHFVIGNGVGSGDGQVEVGPRWEKQKHGAHCKVEGHPEYNDVGIGICLVGNFDLTRPSDDQMDGLARLVHTMMVRYRIPRNRVFGHGQLKATDCPGRNFSYADLWRRVQRLG